MSSSDVNSVSSNLESHGESHKSSPQLSIIARVSGATGGVASGHQPQRAPVRKKRSRPRTPDPDAKVIALSPETLMSTNRYACEICGKGFVRDQNLQLHLRGHNLPSKLVKKEAIKQVYICPESSCLFHNQIWALRDYTTLKKHFRRKHGVKRWKCDNCHKCYGLLLDWKNHSKTCGTPEQTFISRRENFIRHRASPSGGDRGLIPVHVGLDASKPSQPSQPIQLQDDHLVPMGAGVEMFHKGAAVASGADPKKLLFHDGSETAKSLAMGGGWAAFPSPVQKSLRLVAKEGIRNAGTTMTDTQMQLQLYNSGCGFINGPNKIHLGGDNGSMTTIPGMTLGPSTTQEAAHDHMGSACSTWQVPFTAPTLFQGNMVSAGNFCHNAILQHDPGLIHASGELLPTGIMGSVLPSCEQPGFQPHGSMNWGNMNQFQLPNENLLRNQFIDQRRLMLEGNDHQMTRDFLGHR